MKLKKINRSLQWITTFLFVMAAACLVGCHWYDDNLLYKGLSISFFLSWIISSALLFSTNQMIRNTRSNLKAKAEEIDREIEETRKERSVKSYS